MNKSNYPINDNNLGHKQKEIIDILLKDNSNFICQYCYTSGGCDIVVHGNKLYFETTMPRFESLISRGLICSTDTVEYGKEKIDPSSLCKWFINPDYVKSI